MAGYEQRQSESTRHETRYMTEEQTQSHVEVDEGKVEFSDIDQIYQGLL